MQLQVLACMYPWVTQFVVTYSVRFLFVFCSFFVRFLFVFCSFFVRFLFVYVCGAETACRPRWIKQIAMLYINTVATAESHRWKMSTQVDSAKNIEWPVSDRSSEQTLRHDGECFICVRVCARVCVCVCQYVMFVVNFKKRWERGRNYETVLSVRSTSRVLRVSAT